MTLRSQSRKQQVVRWLCAAGLALAAYVVISRLACGSVSFDLTDPRYYRIFVPLLAVAVAFAWETRWDGIVRLESKRHEKDSSHVHTRRHRHHGVERGEKGERGEKVKVQGQGQERNSETQELRNSETQELRNPGNEAKVPTSEAEGYYLAARQIKHHKIPDPERDAVYLEMLGKAALAGYGRALEKLGTYAIRREEWLEAYYWLWQAQRRGVRNLEPLLRKARQHWVKQGFPRHGICASAVFTKERTEIGRALLCQASGHDAAAAREFLRANHPEFLP